MKKINLDELRQKKAEHEEEAGLMGFPIQVKGIHDVKQGLDDLRDLIENQDQYDFDQLRDKLAELNDKLDLEPLFKSLEEAIKNNQNDYTSHTKALVTKQTESFSKLQEALKSMNTKPQITVKAVDTIQEYRASDALVSDTNSYYGFIHPTGKWYILRQSGSTSAAFRYVTGLSKYSEAWRSKENLAYKTYDEVKL